MSVAEPQRAKGELEVSTKAKELAVYTLQITSNSKVFVPDFQTSLTNRIVDAALAIHVNVWSANNIRVRSKEELRERRRLQEEAAIKCNILLSLIQVAWKVFHLTAKRVAYWAEKTQSVRNLIRAWRDSDAARYKIWM